MTRGLNKDAKNTKDFVVQNIESKSDLQPIIRYLCKATNRQKLDYLQLKYIFRCVRQRCDVRAHGNKSYKLFELPTQAEIRRFYGVIDNPIHKLLFEFLAGTGLRISELCNLRVDRIDFSSNTVFIREGKGGKDRLVIMGYRIKEKLLIYLQDRKNTYLFESNRHTKFTPRRIEQICKSYKEKAEIKKNLTPHIFRHVWVTKLAEGGLRKEQRAVLAGHSNEKTQEVYTHLGLDGMKSKVIQILDKTL